MNSRTVQVKYLGWKNQSKIRKSMVLLLKTFQILFGLDLGFFMHRSFKFRLILKITSFIHCVVVGVFIYLNYDIELSLNTFWTALCYLEYLLLILLLSLLKRGSSFMDLQESLEEIDVKLRTELSDSTELKFILTISLIYLHQFTVTGYDYFCIYKYFDYVSVSDVYVFVFITSCSDVSLACYSFVFYSLYLRLAKLRLVLETNDDFDSVQRLYKEIVDTVEKYKRAFDPVYMLILISNIPQVMATIYYTIRELQNQADAMTFVTLGVKYFYVLKTLALTIAPALAAEMLTTKAEEMKTILHDKRLLQGMQHMDSLTRFIQYVEARPCRLRVWKLVPLSADLLSMVLSFCVTYLIVIVQFTNVQIND